MHLAPMALPGQPRQFADSVRNTVAVEQLLGTFRKHGRHKAQFRDGDSLWLMTIRLVARLATMRPMAIPMKAVNPIAIPPRLTTIQAAVQSKMQTARPAVPAPGFRGIFLLFIRVCNM